MSEPATQPNLIAGTAPGLKGDEGVWGFVGYPYWAELQALQGRCEELADDVRGLLGALVDVGLETFVCWRIATTTHAKEVTVGNRLKKRNAAVARAITPFTEG